LNQPKSYPLGAARTDTRHTAQLPDQFLQQIGIFYSWHGSEKLCRLYYSITPSSPILLSPDLLPSPRFGAPSLCFYQKP
jgi:hypothetical protein